MGCGRTVKEDTELEVEKSLRGWSPAREGAEGGRVQERFMQGSWSGPTRLHSVYKQALNGKVFPRCLDRALLCSVLSQPLFLPVRALASVCKDPLISEGQCQTHPWPGSPSKAVSFEV